MKKIKPFKCKLSLEFLATTKISRKSKENSIEWPKSNYHRLLENILKNECPEFESPKFRYNRQPWLASSRGVQTRSECIFQSVIFLICKRFQGFMFGDIRGRTKQCKVPISSGSTLRTMRPWLEEKQTIPPAVTFSIPLRIANTIGAPKNSCCHNHPKNMPQSSENMSYSSR